MTNEIWKDIPGYEGYYQASTLGRIKSVDRYTITSIGRHMFYKGKIISQKRSKKGYYDVTLSKSSIAKTIRVHRLVSLAFTPNRNNYPAINHIDGNKNNNLPDNLEWCTASQNMLHAIKNHLKIPGKPPILLGLANPNTKINPSLVKGIRDEYSAGKISHRKLAAKYNVSKTTMQSILKFNHFKYVS